MLIAVLGLGLNLVLHRMDGWLLAIGLSERTANWLTAHSGWRLLMLAGATPAALTLLIRLFVPESERWHEENRRGTTSHWATADLLGIIVGAAAAIGLIALWAQDMRQIADVVGVPATWGTIAAALLADWIGRRLAYVAMCVASLGSLLWFYQGNTAFDTQFLVAATLVGFMTASFYGWLPLYLPELFPTRVRATGQGFSFNFGRILAAMGVMQMGALVGLFAGYPQAGSIMSAIYVVGVVVIWLAPETHNQPLPE
jgi:MFS family permease